MTQTVINRAVDSVQAQMIEQLAGSIGINVAIKVLERVAWTSTLVQTAGSTGGVCVLATMRNPINTRLDEAVSTYDPEERQAVDAEPAQLAFENPWYGHLLQQNWAFTDKLQDIQENRTSNWISTEKWLASASGRRVVTSGGDHTV